MVNPRLSETLKSETETEKFSDLIEKHLYDRHTQNLRPRDPLLGCARFRDLGRICRDFLIFRGPFTTPIRDLPPPPPLAFPSYFHSKSPKLPENLQVFALLHNVPSA